MPAEIELKLDSSFSVFCLPNSQSEVKFIYNEVFRDNCYFQHGIQLNEGEVVVDAGANIGLFALQVLKKAKDISYFGYEPVPKIFQCLQKNLKTSGDTNDTRIRIFNQGLADTAKKSEFTFRPQLPGNSTVYSDEQRLEVRNMVQKIRLKDIWHWHKGLFFLILLVFPFRLSIIQWWQNRSYKSAEKISCTFTTLDNFFQDSQISQIDLLKIDVEGSEFDVLKGASDHNLRRVKQVVMEIAPGNKDQLDGLKSRLVNCGFQEICIESLWKKSDPYTDAYPCYLYAHK